MRESRYNAKPNCSYYQLVMDYDLLNLLVVVKKDFPRDKIISSGCSGLLSTERQIEGTLCSHSYHMVPRAGSVASSKQKGAANSLEDPGLV